MSATPARWRPAVFGLALLFPAVVLAEERPDYFAALRYPTFVEVDRSYVARPLNAQRDAPPVLRLRHLVLRLKAYGEESKRWWPKRELLLIETASGRRWVAEATLAPRDSSRMEEPRPLYFLATTRPDARMEHWSGGERKEDLMPGKAAPPEAPCEGRWEQVYGLDASTSYAQMEAAIATVKSAVAEVRDATFEREEVEELVSFSGLRNPDVLKNETQRKMQNATLAWATLLLDRREDCLRSPALALFDDPERPGSLDDWRTLTYLPRDLGVYGVGRNRRFP